MTGLEAFDSTVQKTHGWLSELQEILDLEDRHRAYLALRAVLHALRDHLTVDETAHLGAQLPMLVRGFYYEGWKPSGKPLKDRHKATFLAAVRANLPGDGAEHAERLTKGVFLLLNRRVSGGEIEDVKHVLPPELRALWP